VSQHGEPCSVANQHCKAAANFDPPRSPRATCYACGEPVCTALGCSLTTTTWPWTEPGDKPGQKVRICANCAEEDPLLARRIDADVYLGSGYPQMALEIRWGRAKAQWREHIPGMEPGGKYPKAPERILCAAVWRDDGVEREHQPTVTGIVYCGWRHHVCYGVICSTFPSEEAAIARDRTIEHDGFLTSWNRFVDRQEAMTIAIKRKQVLHVTGHPDDLYSEDLY